MSLHFGAVLLGLAAASSAPLSARAAEPAEVSYRVQFDPAGETLSGLICVPQSAPARRFVATGAEAEKYLLDATRSSGRALAHDDGDLLAQDWQRNECLNYRVELGKIADLRRSDVGYRVGQDLMTAPEMWLWRPRRLENSASAEI